MTPLNITDPEFNYDSEDPDGYRAGMFRLGSLVGAERTGTTLYHLRRASSSAPTTTSTGRRNGCWS